MEATSEQSCLLKPKKTANFNVEPLIFLLNFAVTVTAQFTPNLLLKQTCLHQGHHASQCSNLSFNEATKKIEEKIQPEVAQILMTMSIINSVMLGFMSFFLLPWTDIYGRKKVICASLLGNAATFCVLSILATMTDRDRIFNPWIYVVSAIPNAATGDLHTFNMAVLCYISDNTDEASRSRRYFLIEIFTYSGAFLGLVLCSFDFFIGTSSKVVFFCFGLTAFSLIYAIVMLNDKRDSFIAVSFIEAIRSLFCWSVVADVTETCFKPRPQSKRKILWCMLCLMALIFFVKTGTETVFYLFLREKFGWTMKDFSIFQTELSVTSFLGCTLGLFVLKNILGLKDTTLSVIAIISCLIEATVFAGMKSPVLVYVTAVVCLLKSSVFVTFRSITSCQVSSSEIGKVFCFMNLLISVSCLVASPTYTFVYSETFVHFPGAFFIVSIAVFSLSLAIVGVVMREKRGIRY